MDRQSQQGIFKLTVYRADGKVEDAGTWPNLFVTEGQNYLAGFQSTSPASVMNHMLVGTVSTAATYTNLVDSFGEVARVTMATRTAAVNVLTEVATFAGGLNGITSVVLREVGVTNDARSGPNGDLRSRTVYAAVTLAASDFLNISYTSTCS